MRKSLAFGLRARNVDVLTASEARMINRAEEDHLATASASEHVLYTFNVADYCVLHRLGFLNGGFTPGSSWLHSKDASLTAEEMRNRIEFLSAWF